MDSRVREMVSKVRKAFEECEASEEEKLDALLEEGHAVARRIHEGSEGEQRQIVRQSVPDES